MRRSSAAALRGAVRRARASFSTEAAPDALSAGAEGEPGYFVGAPASAYTTQLQFFKPKVDSLPAIMPSYRIFDDEGVVLPGAVVPEIDRET